MLAFIVIWIEWFLHNLTLLHFALTSLVSYENIDLNIVLQNNTINTSPPPFLETFPLFLYPSLAEWWRRFISVWRGGGRRGSIRSHHKYRNRRTQETFFKGASVHDVWIWGRPESIYRKCWPSGGFGHWVHNTDGRIPCIAFCLVDVHAEYLRVKIYQYMH